MNERIQERARQYVNENCPGSFVKYNPEWFAFYNKKFAELLIRECGQYLNSPEFIGRSDLDWAMVLNEHFGVK